MNPERRRRRSALADEHPAYVTPAQPQPATPAPAPPPAPAPQRTDTETTPSPAASGTAARGRSRNLAEARGRKHARDAAYAWAAAEARTRLRLAELLAELDAATGRGTDPAVLAEYVHEACTRNDLDPTQLPTAIRARFARS